MTRFDSLKEILGLDSSGPPDSAFRIDFNEREFQLLVLGLLAAGGAAGAVSIADGIDVAQGAKADAAVTNPASSASVIALLKGILTEDVAILAKLPAAGTATTPNANVISTQGPAITQVISTALEASHVLKASAGQLVHLAVANTGAVDQFILLINATSLPGNGAVTLLYPPIPIKAGATIILDFPRPLVASTGIVACNSTTGTFTKTVGAADCAFYGQVN